MSYKIRKTHKLDNQRIYNLLYSHVENKDLRKDIKEHIKNNTSFKLQNEKGEIVPELIELQSFPTLYCFQKELQNAFVSEYDFLKPLKTPKSDEQYYQELRDLIVGDENPENVILMEIFPDSQKTNIDFYLTKKRLGIEIVCLTKVKKEGRKLYYEKVFSKNPIIVFSAKYSYRNKSTRVR